MLFEVQYISNMSYPNVITERVTADNSSNASLKIERNIQDAFIISFESVNAVNNVKELICEEIYIR